MLFIIENRSPAVKESQAAFYHIIGRQSKTFRNILMRRGAGGFRTRGSSKLPTKSNQAEATPRPDFSSPVENLE
jgi:hypothetical protein